MPNKVKTFCDTNKLPTLSFCGTHPKTHVVRGLSKQYHLCFYPKLGHGIFYIRHILCAVLACTPMIYKTYIYGNP